MEVSFQTGYLLKSSWLSLPLGLRRLFFQKLTCLDFSDMPIFGKSDFAQIWSDLVYFNLEILKDWNLWTSGPFQDHGIGTLGLLDHLGQDLFLANQAGWGIAPR